MVHYFNEKTPAGKLEVSSRASSNFRRFGRIRLSHRNVRLFGTVWWLLYGRRRWVWELAQVKWHGGRMPKSPAAITWFRRRRSVPKLACAGQSRIGGTGAP